MSLRNAAATTAPIGPNIAGPPKCRVKSTTEPGPFGVIVTRSLTFTPPLPCPSRDSPVGGSYFLRVHLTRLYMPFTHTMESITVPVSSVSGNALRQAV